MSPHPRGSLLGLRGRVQAQLGQTGQDTRLVPDSHLQGPWGTHSLPPNHLSGNLEHAGYFMAHFSSSTNICLAGLHFFALSQSWFPLFIIVSCSLCANGHLELRGGKRWLCGGLTGSFGEGDPLRPRLTQPHTRISYVCSVPRALLWPLSPAFIYLFLKFYLF